MKEIYTSESLLKEVDFFMENGVGNKDQLMKFKHNINILASRENNLMPEKTAEKIISNIEKWEPEHEGLYLFKLSLIIYILQLTY